MSVYVDTPLRWQGQSVCLLYADSPSELERMATWLGLDFSSRSDRREAGGVPGLPTHYKIGPVQRERALRRGAEEHTDGRREEWRRGMLDAVTGGAA